MTVSAESPEVIVWRLIRETVMNHLAVRRAEVSDRLGMSFIKAKALRVLTAGPLTMGELTASLCTDAPYTSVVVDDLVDRGLTVRTAHSSDRRRKIVQLTPAGSRIADVAQEVLDRPPAGFADLPDAELAQLHYLFGRLSPGMDQLPRHG